MQYKKDELRAVILAEAENEFFDKGYMNASLRRIAKRAGTTIGNVYNYFENKEALFDELVRDEYNAFIYLINNHSNLEIPVDVVDLNDVGVLRKLMNDFFTHLMPAFSRRFLIMLDLSEGTKYQNTKNEFIDFMTEHFSEHIAESMEPLPADLPRIIAVQVLSGITYIIRNYDDENIKQQLICELLLYNIEGLMGFLNKSF
jgi:Transcriptional regulator